MKLTEVTTHQQPKTQLQKLQERQFTLELNGAQLLALTLVANKIAGGGFARKTFSSWEHSIIGLVPEDINKLADRLLTLSRTDIKQCCINGIITFHSDRLEEQLK